MGNQLLGMHHVTAMTSSIEKNYEFFTKVLGMRLIKKTVNQDDIQTYHTFFGDDLASPGTDMTFFDFPNNPKGIKGNNSISRISYRVPSNEALIYWEKRLTEFSIEHGKVEDFFGKKILQFQDFDEQRYQLISDENNEGVAPGIAWKNGPVPEEFAIVGLGPVEISTHHIDAYEKWLVGILQFRKVAESEDSYLFEVGNGGNGAQVVLKYLPDSIPDAIQGYGEVHHMAFRVESSEALHHWIDLVTSAGLPNSGYVDRFYFEALYVPIGSVLFEFSTDGPGFMQDEPYETLGEKLSIPPHLEAERAYIESAIRPFKTVWENKKE